MSLRALARSMTIRGQVAARLDVRRRRALERAMHETTSRYIRISNLHGTPEREEAQLQRQIRWVSEHFAVVNADALRSWRPEQFDVSADPRVRALFTFDDGLASNYHVAAPLLEASGCRGLFFVVPRFSELTGSAAREYFEQNLYPNARRHVSDEDWTPMTPDQIADLAHRGHVIGNHTLSHSRLSEVPVGELDWEIVHSADAIETWIGGPVDMFAWTFAWDCVRADAWRVACERHALCFSPCAGVVDMANDKPTLVWRTPVTSESPSVEYRFSYSGLADKHWRHRRKQLAATLGMES